MIKWSESLSFIVFPIPNNVHALVAGKTVMQRRSGNTQLKWPIWHNLRLLPTFCFAPVYGEHVVGVDTAELRGTVWFLLGNRSLGKLNIFGSECTAVVNFLLGHLHLWLEFRCGLHRGESSAIYFADRDS